MEENGLGGATGMWDQIRDSKVLWEPCGMHSRPFLWRGAVSAAGVCPRPPSTGQSQPADVDVLALPDRGL